MWHVVPWAALVGLIAPYYPEGIRAKVGASLQGAQTPVWLYQGALSGTEEERATTQDPVCAIEPVDGLPSIADTH